MSFIGRLYRGEFHADFLTPRKRWYVASAIVLLVCVASLVFRGFHLGIDFKGGASFEFPRSGQSVTVAGDTVRGAGTSVEVSQAVGADRVRIQPPPLNEPEINRVT